MNDLVGKQCTIQQTKIKILSRLNDAYPVGSDDSLGPLYKVQRIDD